MTTNTSDFYIPLFLSDSLSPIVFLQLAFVFFISIYLMCCDAEYSVKLLISWCLGFPLFSQQLPHNCITLSLITTTIYFKHNAKR
jgi:hypothetical protein